MQEFKMSDELIKKIEADVGNRIFPGLLRAVSGAVYTKLLAVIADRAEEISDDSIPQVSEPEISKFPPKVVIGLVGSGTAEQENAYRSAFKTVYESDLSDKPKFLRTLYGAGVK